MKTRIISAAVALILLAGVLYAGASFPIVITIFISFISAVAAHEILHTTKLVKNNILTVGGIVYSALMPFIYTNYLPVDASHAGIVFAIFLVLVTLIKHSSTEVSELCAAFALPVFVSFSFSNLGILMAAADGHGLFYFLLACAFAWGCDTGAYFTGVFFGKHKMAPILSPKKTWEGAAGGLVFAAGISALIAVIFNKISADSTANILIITLIAPVFAVLGMIGDIAASYIKRKTGIKDYGKIMPGHGGVLDRFDSLLLIAPVFASFLQLVNIVSSR